jgi:hypothetical protein
VCPCGGCAAGRQGRRVEGFDEAVTCLYAKGADCRAEKRIAVAD